MDSSSHFHSHTCRTRAMMWTRRWEPEFHSRHVQAFLCLRMCRRAAQKQRWRNLGTRVIKRKYNSWMKYIDISNAFIVIFNLSLVSMFFYSGYRSFVGKVKKLYHSKRYNTTVDWSYSTVKILHRIIYKYIVSKPVNIRNTACKRICNRFMD
jgi:hypothetical protein